jgi:ubiquinone/menaquinone biosynthesis C-methylase UbiE
MESKHTKRKSSHLKSSKSTHGEELPFFLKKDNRKTKRERLVKKSAPLYDVKKASTSPAREKVADDSTSWGNVSSWYDAHLQGEKKTYHDTIVYPNILRLLGNMHGKAVLDLACGQGIFSHRLAREGARVIGVDMASELISIAKKSTSAGENVDFFVSSSHDLFMIKNASIDIILISLALQNIEKIQETFAECARVLKKGGKLFIVMNHPSFRIPGESRWDFDEHESVQYRRIDSYLSESKVKIDMTPGSKTEKKFTISGVQQSS